MTRIGVLPNIDKDINLEYTKSIVLWLQEKGYKPFVMKKFSNTLDGCEYFDTMHDLCRESDFIVVLGGDGTILDKASIAAKFDTPLLGINLGTLGYLTDVEKSEGKKALEKVFRNEYTIERRIMLELDLDNGTDNEKHIALNDIYVIRGDMSKMITTNIKINGQYIDTYRADGVIVSSPSGSTAYNLSAGGPVVKPDLDIMLITPICPHKIYSRPSVVSGNDVVTIQLDEMSSDDAVISVDGKNIGNLNKGDTINISKSKYCTSIMRTNNLGFYDILRNKFSISR